MWQTEHMSLPPEPTHDELTAPRPPSGLPRVLIMLLGMAAVFITAQGIQPVRSTLAAAFMALNLVIVVWPIQRRLSRHIPRFLAAMVAGLTAIAVLFVLIWSMGWTIARLVQELPRYTGQYYHMIDQLNEFAVSHNIDANAVTSQIWSLIRQINFSTVIGTVGQVASGLTNIVGLMLMIIIILIFMVLDSAGFSERMRRLGDRHSPTLAWALTSFAAGTRKYWVVTSCFGLIVAFGNWVLLMSLGIPLAVIWAIFSFVTNYVPNIGFIIGLIPPVLMALLSGDPLTALWVVVGYSAINVVFQTFIQPKVAGDAVGITPTIAILSLLLWAYVLGPLGAILAIPATLLMKTLFIDIDPRARWLNAFIASNPATSDQDPIRFSDLMARAKRMRVLSGIITSPGVTPDKAEAANRELSALVQQAEDEASTIEAGASEGTTTEPIPATSDPQ